MELAAKIASNPFKTEKTKDGDNLVTLNIGQDERTLCEFYNHYYNKNLKIEVKELRSKRSNEANNLLWKCINLLAAALNNDNWDQYLIELERYGKYTCILVGADGYDDLKNLWRDTKKVGERTSLDGKVFYEVLCFYGSSTYDSKEFSRLLDGVIEDMKDTGVVLPTQEVIEKAKKNR